jgi:dipeptidyl aminopeptidase/acylaminoacyl peptidase
MASYSEVMVRFAATPSRSWFCLAFLGAAMGAGAAPAPFTINQVLGSAFPTHLTAAPSGGKVAWVSNARGVVNIMVAEPPAYTARKITSYAEDDGQDIVELSWAPDARAIVYVRGGGPNRAGEIPNPALDPQGEQQTVWIVALDGSVPRKIGEGNSVAVSPAGDRVVYAWRGQLWWASLHGKTPPAQPFQTRGQSQQPVWSPDRRSIAFVSERGDHSFVGVYETGANSLRYLDPSTDQDSEPAWSPDSRSVAFLREPSHGKGRIYGARRSDEPWSIRVAEAATGKGREVWRAHEGPGSVFREVVADHQLLWAGDRLVFPWEGDGWTHLYSVPAAGGQENLLTPGEFEVEFVALSPSGREVVFNSNQGDVDRRHLWKVDIKGGPAVALTTGQGIEWAPAETSDSKAVALIRSDAQRPAHPSILLGKEIHDMDPSAIPSDFPSDKMVTPQPVTFTSADGLTIHGQLFLPPQRAAGRAPGVIFFHGGSRRQMLLGWHYRSYYHNAYALNQYLANKGYVVLSVNYRSGIGYGLNFREALNFGSTGASEYNDVVAAGQVLRARADVDPARIGVWGGSYGGYLTAMALAKASDVFRVGVDMHGVHDWSLEYDIPPTDPASKVAFDSSPMAFVSTWRSPVLLVHGDDDRNVKFNQTVMLADALRKRQVPVEDLIFPDEVHEFLLYRHWREAYEAADRFLEKYLSH